MLYEDVNVHRARKKVVILLLPLTLPDTNWFSNFFHGRLSSKFLDYHTVLHMRRYDTLWNVCAQKSPWPTAEWSELLCKTQTFETLAEKCSSRDVSIICVHWRKDI